MYSYQKFYRYFVASFLIFIFCYIALFYLQLGVPTEDSRYLKQWIDQKLSYAQSVEGRKLILLSGSNTLFGIDAEMLQRSLSIPTVNMGINAGLGMEYILTLGRISIKEGDVVVLPLEYKLYEDASIHYALTTYILGRDPSYFINANASQKIKFVFSVGPKRVLSGIKARVWPDAQIKNNPYDGKYLNKNGDMQNNLYENKLENKNLLTQTSPMIFQSSESLSSEALGELKRFIADCKTKNVLVLAAFPAFLSKDQSLGKKDIEVIQRIVEFYQSQGVPVLGTYDESLYDVDDFYDTEYHLNNIGKQKRTQQMIMYLEPYIPKE